jgi:DNA-binding NarL/FixJ family response regulator
MKHFKEEGGRKIMCEAVEKYAKSYAEQYAENSRMDERSETIKHMLGKGKSSEEIADLCGYDLKFVRQVEESMAQTV